MNIETFSDFNKFIYEVSIEIDDENGMPERVDLAEIPFPQCKIMQVSHLRFFTDHPSMVRDFKLEGDELLECSSHDDIRTFWVPLGAQDDWWTIIEKAAELSRLSGDRHHIRLEGFSVVKDILIPIFSS